MGNPLATRNNNYRWLRLFVSFGGVFVGSLAFRLYENRRTLSWQWMVGSVVVGLVATAVMWAADARQRRNSLAAAKQNLYRD